MIPPSEVQQGVVKFYSLHSVHHRCSLLHVYAHFALLNINYHAPANPSDEHDKIDRNNWPILPDLIESNFYFVSIVYSASLTPTPHPGAYAKHLSERDV